MTVCVIMAWPGLCFVLLCCVGVQLTNYVIVIEKRNLMDFVSKMVCRPQTSGDDGDLEQEGRVVSRWDGVTLFK